ncbi:MAG TPA: GNAT family N-acetyltransferase [Patescibacteria group bacterium]|nr:GNAT family N-acetyltransferase [Patescibacteria group bacterium]
MNKKTSFEKAGIRYRRATINDVETLVNFRIRFLNELDNHPENEKTQMLRNSLKQYFSESIPSNCFVGWLAECEGKIVGTSGMVVWQMPGRYGGLEEGRLGYILNMYTVPEARRRGVCTRLLDELMKEARKLGLKYLQLHASEDGVGIYKRAGFTCPKQIEMTMRL